jgi:hypothetical protein
MPITSARKRVRRSVDAAGLGVRLCGIYTGSLLAQNCQCSLDHEPVRYILVAHCLLCEQQPLETDGSDGDAVQVQSLAISPEGVVCLAIRVEHDVNNERISDADILAFFEPLWFEFLRCLVRQNHERFLYALARGGGGGENDIDVGCRALVAMSGEGVSAYQQVVNAVGVERTQ